MNIRSVGVLLYYSLANTFHSFIRLLETDYMFETLGFKVDNDCESFCCWVCAQGFMIARSGRRYAGAGRGYLSENVGADYWAFSQKVSIRYYTTIFPEVYYQKSSRIQIRLNCLRFGITHVRTRAFLHAGRNHARYTFVEACAYNAFSCWIRFD